MSNYRRTIARVVLPIISIWLCWLPSQAYAALPAAAGVYVVAPSAVGAVSNVIAGPWAGSAASAAGLTSAGAIAMGAAVGASALYVGIKVGYMVVDNLTGGYSRIPLTAASPVPVPTGAPVPTIPAHSSYRAALATGGVAGAWRTTQCEAFTDFVGYLTWNNQPAYVYEVVQCVENGVQTWRSKQVSTGAYSAPNTSAGWMQNQAVAISCPSGSTIAGTAPNQTCTVNNPRTVYPDHSQDYARSGTTLAPAAGEADAAVGAVSSLPSGGLLIQDQTASGEARHYKIIPAVDGGSQVEFYQPVTNAVGDTGTQRTVVTVAPDGTITGKTQTTTGEQLGQDPATGLPVLNPAPVGSTFTPSSPSGSTVTFPNDYARAGEAAQAAQSSNTKLDTLHNDLSVTTLVADPVAPVAGDMPTWGDTFTNLLSWQLPPHAAVCPTPTLNLTAIGMGTNQYTSHCALLNDHSAPVHGSMVAVFTILALFIVLRA